jgi:hypothetical protein
MSDSATAGSPLLKATTIGTILQVLMVVGGHFMPQLAQLFPVLGTGLGGLTGLLFALFNKGATGGALAGGGAAAGGIGGLVGSAISMAMGDVPGATVGIAAGSTAVAGAIGAILGKLLGGKSA